MMVNEFRCKGKHYQGLSFKTTSSAGENAAIIHYKPTKEEAAKVTKDKIYLLDSGAQYIDGTTDTTRTVHFSTPSDWEKEMYTRVLKGNLLLERTIWPKDSGISGAHLDSYARKYLWEIGKDFGHGTGHGVGHYLNVHEGPCGINRSRTEELKPGMCCSDEPGYYEEGNFGIRIENVLIV